jgi:nickel-dependent lactate racemase
MPSETALSRDNSYGIDILANAEVMSCDLKIAIGSVVPHHAAGFSGGAKIILPGVCSFETNQAFHRYAMEFHRQNPQIPVGNCIIENNALRLNMAEAARLVGLDIKIDTLMNSRCETVAVYAGKPEIEFEAAVQAARSHYLSSVAADCDISIANTFAKVGEFECGLGIACFFKKGRRRRSDYL